MKLAKLRTNAMVEDVDFRRKRGLDRAQFLTLTAGGFVASHHDVLVAGTSQLPVANWHTALGDPTIAEFLL